MAVTFTHLDASEKVNDISVAQLTTQDVPLLASEAAHVEAISLSRQLMRQVDTARHETSTRKKAKARSAAPGKKVTEVTPAQTDKDHLIPPMMEFMKEAAIMQEDQSATQAEIDAAY